MSDKTITLSDIPVIKELVQEEIEKKTTPLEAEIEDVKKNGDKVEEITYSNLLAKVNTGTLTAGQQYRITDYVTTTAQADTQSAGHQFDIIVTADSATTLNHTARAVLHSGDTYFANSNLAAWELKYDIKNDTTKYAWASSSGKGVIYEMVDEFNNKCGYDFKNILYTRYKITSQTGGDDLSWLVGLYAGRFDWVHGASLPSSCDWSTSMSNSDKIYIYTFGIRTSAGVISDASLNSSGKCCCHSNVIEPVVATYYGNDEKLMLNYIIFHYTSNTHYMYGNKVRESFDMWFSGGCSNNIFGQGGRNNTFVSCSNNIFGQGCKFSAIRSSNNNTLIALSDYSASSLNRKIIVNGVEK